MVEKKEEFVVWPGKRAGCVIHDGVEMTPPEGWIFVESGDAGLTRRIKAGGDYWRLVHRRRNRIESLGLWAPALLVERLKKTLNAERSDPSYARKLEAGRRRRALEQWEYVQEFRHAVLKFLAFAPRWAEFAVRLAEAVTELAVPVGSGTVARTQTIPVERRAEAAVIAWMRHQTTAYDHMSIARIKGERREVRRRLAARSRQILDQYRSGADVDRAACPLAKALAEPKTQVQSKQEENR